MPDFWQLSFELDTSACEAAADCCFAHGASAVTFVDAQDEPVLEPLPGELRLWPSTQLRALFAQETDRDAITIRIASALALEPDALQWQHIADRLWEREWLRDFHAMRFGERLWISPQHEQVDAPGAIVVHLEPGLAFGTGTHPSTRVCLEWLDEHVKPGQRVIDYGCGSGILAIAALRLGAARAACFDIDAQALLATSQNAQLNEVASQLSICTLSSSLPDDVDLLLANILATPLIELAPRFGSLVRPGGTVVLAGLMEQEIGDVTAAYATCFDIHPFAIRDGWVGLAGRRNTPRRAARVVKPHRPSSAEGSTGAPNAPTE